MKDHTRYVENRLSQLKLNYKDIFENWLNNNTIITHKKHGYKVSSYEVELI